MAGTGHRITHVEIRNRPSGVDSASDHLEELTSTDTATHTGKKKRRKRSHDRARDERHNVRPHGQRRLSFEHADKTYANVIGIIDIVDGIGRIACAHRRRMLKVTEEHTTTREPRRTSAWQPTVDQVVSFRARA